MTSNIDIVDFSALAINKEEKLINWHVDGVAVGKQIIAAFEDIGFAFIQNFGIDENEVSGFHKECESFFQLSVDVKNESRRPDNGNSGYVSVGREALEPGRPHDLREAYNMTPDGNKQVWPSKEVVPHFQDSMTKMFDKCHCITLRILQALALGMDYKDKDLFLSTHKSIGKGPNATTLRALYYPAVPENILPNQIRCGEHSDYGSLTLLFQDDGGGLQVKQRNGKFVEVTPVPGALLVNVGDLLMRWSADRFISTRHRVLIPTDDRRDKVRQSAAFFVHFDDDYLVECIDGSKKYEAITAGQYLKGRFEDSYGETGRK